MIRVILENLVKRQDGVAVIDGVSLELPPGDLTAAVGPSGAGKTMLGRLVAGLETPDDGEIYFDGRAVHTLSPADRASGLVCAGDSLWPHLTIAENVGYGLKARKIARRDRKRRVAEVLALAGIDSAGPKRPGELAPLARRKAAIARALALGPQALTIDEPFAGLDSRSRQEMGRELQRIHEEAQVTTLVLAAEPRDVMAIADHLAILDLGKVVQSGPPRDVYSQPANAFAAQFLGAVNLLQGQAEMASDPGLVLVRTPLGKFEGRRPDGELAAGTPVTLAIRPESLTLGASSAESEPESEALNRFRASLERVEFHGPLVLHHLRGAGNWPLTVASLREFGRGLQPGQVLSVLADPDQVIVLPTGPSL